MKIKHGKIKTLGVIADIRHCKGLVIETLTSQPEREDLLRVVHEFIADPMYNVYGLRHKENDMTEPFTVESKPVLVNRFGWFITQDTMKFPKGQTYVQLSTSNSKYYECIEYDPDIELGKKHNVFDAKPITVTHYVNDEDDIRNAMDELSQEENEVETN